MASTIAKINFELVSNTLYMERGGFSIDRSLLDPSNANAILDGEWVRSADGKVAVRATDVTSTGAEPTYADDQFYPVLTKSGRTDLQALADSRIATITLGGYRANTRLFDKDAVVGSGAAISRVGQGLKIATILISGRKATGLVGHGGSGDSAKVVARVYMLPSDNGGKLMIRSVDR